MKDTVTFRFRSWSLIPTEDCWSAWTHCRRETMMTFLRALEDIDETSTARLSPDYQKKYRSLLEVQVIANEYDCWSWRPGGSWQRMEADPRYADVPTGKGKRPPRKSRAQLEAEQRAADDEIFGTAQE